MYLDPAMIKVNSDVCLFGGGGLVTERVQSSTADRSDSGNGVISEKR